MDIKHLRIFICVAKCENITKASEELFMTQPAVSLAIRKLESFYNVRLFARSGQRIHISAEGSELLAYAIGVVKKFEDFEAVALKKGKMQNIRIACSLSTGDSLLPRIMKKLEESHNITFSYDITTSDKVINDVLISQADLGLVETPVIDKRLEVIPLLDDHLVGVVNTSSKIKRTISINQLSEYPLLLRNENSGTRVTFDEAVAKFALSLQIKCVSLSNEALIQFALNDLGIAFVPFSTCQEYLEKGLLEEIKIENVLFNRVISLVYLKSNYLKTDVKDVIEQIENNKNY